MLRPSTRSEKRKLRRSWIQNGEIVPQGSLGQAIQGPRLGKEWFRREVEEWSEKMWLTQMRLGSCFYCGLPSSVSTKQRS